jgi:ApaG protein
VGKVQEVRGPGVVGQQPYLPPGDSYSYDSACPLDTPFGTMHGSYQMVRDDGRTFNATIAPFLLTQPHGVN